jgi:hypothetical protein
VDIPLDTIADIGVLGEHLDRIDREVDSDPAGAISAAKALIESTARSSSARPEARGRRTSSSRYWYPVRRKRLGSWLPIRQAT